jgi:hypothetical protein
MRSSKGFGAAGLVEAAVLVEEAVFAEVAVLVEVAAFAEATIAPNINSKVACIKKVLNFFILNKYKVLK